MSILEQTPGLLEAMRGEMTPKFMATRSPDGVPNVVPCVSILPADDQPDTLIFGNFLLRKSIKNLETDPRLSVLVITEDLQGWILKGDFVEFQRTGPYVDIQMNSNLLRYNAYTGIRNAGVIKVRSLESIFSISKLQVVKDYLMARFNASRNPGMNEIGIKIPSPVRQEFARMIAVKVLSWIGEDDYPTIVPALSLQPASEQSMVGWFDQADLPTPPPGVQVAANILTFDAISYQAKGRWYPFGKAGAVQLHEIYAGGPPYPGGQVA